MTNFESYEVVVGLEVHAQLLTQSKLFCGDSIVFGAEPNTHVSSITLGHPGTLPKMNKKAIELAVRMGLVCHCEIMRENYFARKNYFYPDLPKGYQISQHTKPICKGGFIKIMIGPLTEAGVEKVVKGYDKNIRLNRIHLEEDAGKSLHDIEDNYTSLDFNRAGTPLIEIVTEPDIRSGEEAFAFLSEIRKLLRYLGICDGNMEEGSLRCDANISVRKKGETALGTKVEVKNLNSVRNVKRAIGAEAKRLIGKLEQGEKIVQQTRGYDDSKGSTFAIRNKEDADDYRYFAEPDLTPFHLQDEFIEKIHRSIPALPEERIRKYIAEFRLSEYDASLLSEERSFADYFEKVISSLPSSLNGDASGVKPKSAANWMLGPVKSWLNENNKELSGFPVSPERLATLIHLIEEGKISFTSASTKIFPHMLQFSGKEPAEIAIELNLMQQSDLSDIGPIVDAVLKKFAGKVSEYKKGKKGLFALFVGEVMKHSKGKADPGIVNELLSEKLK